MTDRELLEMAAKAAGIECAGYSANGIHCPAMDMACGYEYWNPLTDDGDALRLAVILNMAITVSNHETHCEGTKNEYAYELHKSSDQFAATRRAIVRAAAAIGKAM